MRRVRILVFVGVCALLVTGCGAANSIVNPKGSEAKSIAGIWWVAFGLATFVYVVVSGLIIYAITRGHRKGARTSGLRENSFIWVGGVIVPVLILAVIAVLTVQTTASLRAASPDELHIDVTGKLWWWGVRYPASGIVTANELHLPAGQPVDIHLTSDNVVHSFWVPQLAGKEDVIPGQPNDLRFTAKTVGTYIGECAEFCGLQHAHMGFRVVVQTPADFGRWVARRQIVPSEPVSDEAAKGATIFDAQACAGCHTIRGTSANGKVGPDLTDFGSRPTIGAGALENHQQNLEKWIRDAPAIKPGTAMPSFRSLSEGDIAAITAYLESLK
jgi:cytochrome c oxidase subunit 2